MTPTPTRTAAATGTVLAGGPGLLVSAHLVAGSDVATATIYDGTDTSGPVITRLSAVANSADAYCPAAAIPFRTGLHVVMTGTGPLLTLQV